jgi:hypothetical protein
MFILALRRRFALLMTGFALLLALSCGNSDGPAPYHEQQPQALWFSDLHFDPFADPDLVTRLVQADVTQWYALFAGSEDHARTPSSGKGTNHWLLESCLAQMGMQAPRPDLILYTGDFLTHWFNETYATMSGDESEAGLQAFIDKTLAYIVLRLSHYYPHTPVFFCLGNNDAYEDNYGVTPDSPFLENSAWTLGPGLLKQARHLTSFFATYPHGGHFEAYPSTTAGWRILSLNTNFLSTHAPSHSDAPAEAQLDWLAAQLSDAAAAGDKVWLLSHIPPGVDVFATRIANGFSDGLPEQVVPLMKEMHLARFKALLSQHASSVTHIAGITGCQAIFHVPLAAVCRARQERGDRENKHRGDTLNRIKSHILLQNACMLFLPDSASSIDRNPFILSSSGFVHQPCFDIKAYQLSSGAFQWYRRLCRSSHPWKR